jgi:polar amino acid transport system substrate-binding protein
MDKKWMWLVFLSTALLVSCSPSTAALPTVTPVPAATAPIQILLATGEWKPYTSEKMEGLGAFTEIVSAAFEEMGQKPRYVFYPWKRAESETKDGKVFATFPYIMTDERKKDFDFSDPVMISTGKFFYLPERHKSEIVYNQLEDLQAYRVGGTLGYWYETPFKQAGLQVDYTSSDEQNIQKLYLDRVDLIASEELVGWAIIRALYPQEVNRFATVKKPLNEDPLRLMISKQYPGAAELTQRFNAALKAIYAKGIAQKILEKYGLK